LGEDEEEDDDDDDDDEDEDDDGGDDVSVCNTFIYKIEIERERES
jgi:hypothetical protein